MSDSLLGLLKTIRDIDRKDADPERLRVEDGNEVLPEHTALFRRLVLQEVATMYDPRELGVQQLRDLGWDGDL